jgi:AraC-like DNA-binding protein/quercetin dioxygenase-like cupin family protein
MPLRHDHARGLVTIEQALDGVVLGPVVGVAARFRKGDRVQAHWHDYAQLVYAVSGAMTVITDAGLWVVPPNRAVWLPAMERHSFRMAADVEMRTLYVHPSLQPPDLTRACVIQVSPLLHELTQRVIDFGKAYSEASREGRLVALLMDEIAAAPTEPLHVPSPRDPRLITLAGKIAANPGDGRGLAEWGRELGASERTLARLFRRDTGMSFVKWRQQVRLLSALQMLAADTPVTRVAADMGYESTSAFITMFKKSLGFTPSQYSRSRAGE